MPRHATRWVLAFLALGGVGYEVTAAGYGPLAAPLPVSQPRNPGPAAFIPSPYARTETLVFLARARAAEAITDPLQRCLAYPDPPGSHWPVEVVRAYCQFLNEPLIPQAEVIELVHKGRAAEVDRQLAQAQRARLARPPAPGLVDRTFDLDFNDCSQQLREAIDAWMRQSPRSAYAHAASGWSWVAQAQVARGDGDAPLGSLSHVQIIAMRTFLRKARAELDKAITLDPRVTPAYVAMIYADGLDGTRSQTALLRGLGADPANYAIFKRALWREQPRQGGSIVAMRALTSRIRTQIGQNPLLPLLMADPDAVEAGIDCSCTNRAQVDAYRKVFDGPARSRLLGSAGIAAAKGGQQVIAAVYLSEALRFDPSLLDERFYRTQALIAIRELPWAETEGDHLVAMAPSYEYGNSIRAQAHEAAGHWALAEPALRAIIDDDPGDAWALTELGNLYVHRTYAWDKGWDIADRLIQLDPNDAQGWALRASIQKDQPRPGLHGTMVYFVAHFGSDPRYAAVTSEMRNLLAQQNAAALDTDSAP